MAIIRVIFIFGFKVILTFEGYLQKNKLQRFLPKGFSEELRVKNVTFCKNHYFRFRVSNVVLIGG